VSSELSRHRGFPKYPADPEDPASAEATVEAPSTSPAAATATNAPRIVFFIIKSLHCPSMCVMNI